MGTKEVRKMFYDRAFARYNKDTKILGKLNSELEKHNWTVNILGNRFETNEKYIDDKSCVNIIEKIMLNNTNDYVLKIYNNARDLLDKYNLTHINYVQFTRELVVLYLKDTSMAYYKTNYSTLSYILYNRYKKDDRVKDIVKVGMKVLTKIYRHAYFLQNYYNNIRKRFLMSRDIELQYWISSEILDNIGIIDYKDYIKCMFIYDARFYKDNKPIENDKINLLKYRQVIAPNCGFVINVKNSKTVDTILLREIRAYGKHYILVGIRNLLVKGYLAFATIDLKDTKVYTRDTALLREALPYIYKVYEVRCNFNLNMYECEVYTPEWWKYRGEYIQDNKKSQRENITDSYRINSVHIVTWKNRTHSRENAILARAYNIHLDLNQSIRIPKDYKEDILRGLRLERESFLVI